jgi:beta-lactamase regulating signal transducer with metallopeptidase domain
MSLISHIIAYGEFWAHSPNAVRLSSVLLHFVWQGAALAAGAFLLMAALKRARPQVRYAALLAILGALAACPAATWVVIHPDGEPMVATGGASADKNETSGGTHSSDAVRTPKAEQRADRSQDGRDEESAAAVPRVARPIVSNGLATEVDAWLRRYRPWIAMAWLLGVSLLAFRLAVGLCVAEQIRRRGLTPAADPVQEVVLRLAGQLGIRRTVRVFESSLAAAPTLIGWLSPVILLPASALCGLTPVQLRAILAHELAHVRRHDYLVNLLQTVVETLLFYHPAVWWVSRSIRQEREHCCDDMAVDLCGDRIVYARALAALEERRAASWALSVGANGGTLAARIRRIVGRPESSRNRNPSPTAVVFVLLFVSSSLLHVLPAATPAARPVVAEYTFHVVTTHGKPVAGATVRAWAVGWRSGSFLVTEALAPAVKTDANGAARIAFVGNARDPETREFQAAEKKGGIRSIALRVDHPEHPIWAGYLEIRGIRRITLFEPTTIEVRAHRDHDQGRLTRLFPVLSGSLTIGADWAEQDGVLTIHRVDVDSEKASRWLRVVHVPEHGPVLYSELIDLKLRTENPISLDLALKPGVRVEGRLAESVPRPVKNGRLVAAIVTGTDSWTNWVWSATAKIARDGRFVLESMPADENLQFVALCDGWASASPTVQEMADYGAQNGFSAANYHGPLQTCVFPRLYRLQGPKIEPVVPMVRTSTCEVTVVDENGRPLADAQVAFSPNQMLYNAGSRIVGEGFDGLTSIRAQLASGKHRTEPDFHAGGLEKAYMAKTNSRGVAIVTNLPLGGATAVATPAEMGYDVTHDGYANLAGPMNETPKTVKLMAAETGHVTAAA